MKKVKRPSLEASTVYHTCISDTEDIPLKARYQGNAELVNSASIEYANKAESLDFHKIPNPELLLGLSVKDMKKVYTYRMVQRLGRDYYDEIYQLPKLGLCPYCSLHRVQSIDHYLPKSKFPVYSVTPLNLVGACTDCNDFKKVATPDGTEGYLHPYFDDIEDILWLHAEIIEGEIISVNYYPLQSSEMQDSVFTRLKFQFETLELNEMFAVNAATTLSNIKMEMTDLFESGGAEEIRRNLARSARSRRASNINSWETALYVALSENEWYHSEGFRVKTEPSENHES
ncbi:MAG: hypothetical protein K9G41_09755 [Flavobacteriales bacterium]|nr:hypothetical protein [Flavobacteriales bacterium]